MDEEAVARVAFVQLSSGVEEPGAKPERGRQPRPGAEEMPQRLQGVCRLSRGVDIRLDREVVPRLSLGKKRAEGVSGQRGGVARGELPGCFVFRHHFPRQDFGRFHVRLVERLDVHKMPGDSSGKFPEEVLRAEVVAIREGVGKRGVPGLLEGGEVRGRFARERLASERLASEGQGNEQAILPVFGHVRERFPDDGQNPFSELPGAFRDELLHPIAKTLERRGGQEGHFIASGFGEFGKNRPEEEAGVVGVGATGLGHGVGAGDELGHVHPHERGRDKAKVGERGIASANIRIVEENAADLMLPHEGFEATAGVGDGDEVLTGFFKAEFFDSVVEEVFEKGQGFDRATGFGGGDVQRAGGVKGVGGFEDVGRMGGVEDGEGEGGLPGEDAGEHFGREAGAAHAEEEDVGEAFGADFVSEGGEFGGLRGHVGRAVEPAEAVGDFGGGIRPDGVVVRPDAGGDVIRGHPGDGGLDVGLVGSEGRGEVGHGG